MYPSDESQGISKDGGVGGEYLPEWTEPSALYRLVASSG